MDAHRLSDAKSLRGVHSTFGRINSRNAAEQIVRSALHVAVRVHQTPEKDTFNRMPAYSFGQRLNLFTNDFSRRSTSEFKNTIFRGASDHKIRTARDTSMRDHGIEAEMSSKRNRARRFL